MGGMTSEYHEAVRRLKARHRLRLHWIVFGVVQAGLLLLNALTWRGYAWSVWPLLTWGAALLFHSAVVLLPRRRWDEKQVREIMRTLRS